MGSGIATPRRGRERHGMNLVKRVAATEAVIARYRNKPFDWSTTGTCIHLARAQVVSMGHRAPRVPEFRSAIGAGKALKKAGYDRLEDLLDAILPRIAPASMLVGDLALMPGGGGFDAIVIAAGGKVIGYHDDFLDRGVVNVVPEGTSPFIGAWRL
jgi:hypothetical protein